MNPKSKPKLSLDFWLITLSMSVSAILAVGLMKYEKWLLEPRIKKQESREIVGLVTEAHNSSKRRYAGSLTYFDVKPSEKINLGDTIFVDSNSSLELKLSTGSTIRLGAMTLVLVDKESNQIKLILNNGEVEGTISGKDKVLFDINEENLEISGEKGSQFKVTKADLGDSTVTGKKGSLKLRYQDQIHDITNKKFNLTDPNTLSAPPPLPMAKAEAPRERTPAYTMTGETVSLDEIPLDLPIPYPPNKQLLLVKKQATIIVMPRRLCQDDCQITILKNGVEVGRWKFPKKTPPLLKLPVTLSDLGHYQVKLLDKQSSESEFDLQQFSGQSFENAIKANLSVELLD